MTKARLQTMLPYAGIPAAAIAAFILQMRRIDSFTLLRFQLLIIIGYIVAVSDIKEKRIPNSLVLAMLLGWAMIMVPQLFLQTDSAIALLADSALGFAIGGGMFFLVYILSRKGLGGGDVKFMAATGLFLGVFGILPAMLCGTVLASLFGFVLIILKKIGRKDTIPLAPFLYVGILTTIYLW